MADSPGLNPIIGALFRVRQTRLREPKRCAECGTGLPKGTDAVFYPVSGNVSCIECPKPRAVASWPSSLVERA